MILAILLWSALVAALYLFGGALLGMLTPGAAWLQANPEIAAWLEPVLAVLGTLGVTATLVAWAVGAGLIALLFALRPRRRAREALSYDEWRSRDGGRTDRPAGAGRWRQRRYRDDDDDDDDDDDNRRRRRKRRDDDDDD
jgi:hypothetical protein